MFDFKFKSVNPKIILNKIRLLMGQLYSKDNTNEVNENLLSEKYKTLKRIHD
jgi:hypothetical protein